MNLDEALTYARDQGLTDRQIAVAVRAVADDARFVRDDGLVTLTHKVTGGVIRVHPDTVKAHEDSGWQRKDLTQEEEPEEEPE